MTTLILDFGGVISRTLFETHELTEKALGLSPGTLTWRGPFDPENDLLWQNMQQDIITERNYWETRTAEVASLVNKDWRHMSEFVIAARGANPEKVIRPEASQMVTWCKEHNVRLAILSNELDLFYGADFRDKLPLLKDFEVIIDATYSGILKPATKAYEMCLEELQEIATNCVFVDDQKRNIDGAQKANLNTVWFDVQDPKASYAKVQNLLSQLMNTGATHA